MTKEEKLRVIKRLNPTIFEHEGLITLFENKISLFKITERSKTEGDMPNISFLEKGSL